MGRVVGGDERGLAAADGGVNLGLSLDFPSPSVLIRSVSAPVLHVSVDQEACCLNGFYLNNLMNVC